MENNGKKDENALEKSIKQQNLKFSVEFKDGDEEREDDASQQEVSTVNETVTETNLSQVVRVHSEQDGTKHKSSKSSTKTEHHSISKTKAENHSEDNIRESKREINTKRRDKLPTIDFNKRPKESSDQPILSKRCK